MISIIIPTINEEASIGRLLEYLKENAGGFDFQIIVSDGGSTDRTVEIAKQNGAKVVVSEKGRAKQMNAGASCSRGNILYFLHADTYPPKQFMRDIYEAYSQDYKAGCFRLQFDNPSLLLKGYGWFTKFDINLFRFGDQSLFVDSQLFNKIGGFDEQLIVMEDQKIVRELKKKTQFKIIKNRVITSSRKYLKVGIIRLQLIFTTILLMYYMGFTQSVLIKFYRKATAHRNVNVV